MSWKHANAPPVGHEETGVSSSLVKMSPIPSPTDNAADAPGGSTVPAVPGTCTGAVQRPSRESTATTSEWVGPCAATYRSPAASAATLGAE
jgi:hypothetical protein